MRLAILVFACATGLFAQEQPALDVVLLVENSIPSTSLIRRPNLGALWPGDRVALIKFDGKSSVALPLEEDRGRIERAIGELDSKGTPSTTRLWDALFKATELFSGPPDAGRRRAIFLIFSAEDKKSAQTADSVGVALRRVEASLSAATFARQLPSQILPRISKSPSRTPAPQRPAVWSEKAPASEGAVLPGALGSVEALVTETGGLILINEWNFTRLVENARGR